MNILMLFDNRQHWSVTRYNTSEKREFTSSMPPAGLQTYAGYKFALSPTRNDIAPVS